MILNFFPAFIILDLFIDSAVIWRKHFYEEAFLKDQNESIVKMKCTKTLMLMFGGIYQQKYQNVYSAKKCTTDKYNDFNVMHKRN